MFAGRNAALTDTRCRRCSGGSAGATLVMNADEIIGIVTDGDVRRFVESGRSMDEASAGDLMSPDPLSIDMNATLAAAEQLAGKGQRIRVVSMPCWEAFAAQDADYQASVLPAAVSRDKRLALEAGCTLGWSRYADHVIGIDHFGASAPAKVLAEKFGFTLDAVVAKWTSR